MQPDTKQNFIFIDKPAQGMLIHLNTSLEQILDKHDYPLIIKKIFVRLGGLRFGFLA